MDQTRTSPTSNDNSDAIVRRLWHGYVLCAFGALVAQHTLFFLATGMPFGVHLGSLLLASAIPCGGSIYLTWRITRLAAFQRTGRLGRIAIHIAFACLGAIPLIQGMGGIESAIFTVLFLAMFLPLALLPIHISLNEKRIFQCISVVLTAWVTTMLNWAICGNTLRTLSAAYADYRNREMAYDPGVFGKVLLRLSLSKPCGVWVWYIANVLLLLLFLVLLAQTARCFRQVFQNRLSYWRFPAVCLGVLLAGALLLQLPGVFFRHRALKRLNELAASWTLSPAPEQERWEQLAQAPAYKMLKRGWSKIADDKIISHEEAISNKRFAEFDEDNQIYYCQEILPVLPEPNEVRKLLDSARGTPEYRDLTKNLERALRHMISIHLYVAEDVASSEEFWELLLDILEERGNGNYGRLEKQFFGDWFTTLCECSKGLEMMMETNALTLEQNHRLRELLETGRSSASRLIQHEEQIKQMTGTDILFRLMWQGRGGHWGLYDGDYIPLRDCCAVTPGLLWMIARTASKFQALNSTTFDSWQEGYKKSTFWNTCILEDFFADILVGSLYDMEEVFSNIDCRLDLLQEALTLHEQYLATGEWSQTTQADSLAITCGPETFIVHTELWPGNKVSDGSGCCDYEGEVSEGEDWFLVDWEKYERQKEEEDRRDERKALEAPREKEFETLRIHHPRLEKDDDFVIRIGFR